MKEKKRFVLHTQNGILSFVVYSCLLLWCDRHTLYPLYHRRRLACGSSLFVLLSAREQNENVSFRMHSDSVSTPFQASSLFVVVIVDVDVVVGMRSKRQSPNLCTLDCISIVNGFYCYLAPQRIHKSNLRDKNIYFCFLLAIKIKFLEEMSVFLFTFVFVITARRLGRAID